MPQITKQQLSDLRRLSVLLTDYLDAIEDKPIEIDPELQKLVDERVRERICLACLQKALDDDRMRRGQDSACYATTRSRIRRGLVSERQLVMQGKLTAEHAAPGRPAKQDQIAADVAKAQRELAELTAKSARARGEE